METCSDKRKALAPILQRDQNYTNCFRVSIVQGHSITSDSSLVSIDRSFICKSNIWITHISLNLSFISSRFFIEKKGDDAKKVIISRGHIKLKERRGHGFVLPSEFVEGTEFWVNCRIVELAAILKNKSLLTVESLAWSILLSRHHSLFMSFQVSSRYIKSLCHVIMCYFIELFRCVKVYHIFPLFLLCLANKLPFYANFQYDEKAMMEKTFPASKETFLIKIIWDIQAD